MNIREINGINYEILEKQTLEFSEIYFTNIIDSVGAIFFICGADIYSIYTGSDSKGLPPTFKNNRPYPCLDFSYQPEKGDIFEQKGKLEITPMKRIYTEKEIEDRKSFNDALEKVKNAKEDN